MLTGSCVVVNVTIFCYDTVYDENYEQIHLFIFA